MYTREELLEEAKIDNDNGFCDRKGILIEEDDSCESHSSDRDNSVEKRITEGKRE